MTLSAVPDAWLQGEGGIKSRAAYSTWLRTRRSGLPRIIAEVAGANSARV